MTQAGGERGCLVGVGKRSHQLLIRARGAVTTEGMDATRLRYFSAVARTGSLREAADLLRLSPAALSKAVKALEAELGVRLVVPSGRGLAITDAGRRLASRAERLLEEMEGLSEELRSRAAEPAVPLRLGSFEVFTTYFLARLAREAVPGVPLVVHELIPGPLEEALERREIDLGLTYLPVPRAGLEFLEVTSLEMGIYARAGAFDGRPFEQIPFAVPVSPVSGTPTRVRGLDGWPDDRFPRRVLYRVTLLESALALQREGMAAAFIPHFIARLHNETVREELRLSPLPLPAKLGRHRHGVYLVRRRGEEETRIVRRIATALRKLS